MRTKNNLILTFVLFFTSFTFVSGQYLDFTYTPNGSYVAGFVRIDNTASECQFIDALFSDAHPNANMIRSSHRNYNCAGFAMHMSNGVSATKAQKIWINSWRDYFPVNEGGDGSYTRRTTECVGCKADYYIDNHIAIVVQQYGGTIKYQSKWGEGPLFLHDSWDTPYYNPSAIRWYSRNGFNGAEISAFKDSELPNKLVWEVNTDALIIKGFNIYKKKGEKLEKINLDLIPRMNYEELFEKGERYEYPISNIDNEFMLEIIQSDDTNSFLNF